jgi:hypothetical protein
MKALYFILLASCCFLSKSRKMEIEKQISSRFDESWNGKQRVIDSMQVEMAKIEEAKIETQRSCSG